MIYTKRSDLYLKIGEHFFPCRHFNSEAFVIKITKTAEYGKPRNDTFVLESFFFYLYKI